VLPDFHAVVQRLAGAGLGGAAGMFGPPPPPDNGAAGTLGPPPSPDNGAAGTFGPPPPPDDGAAGTFGPPPPPNDGVAGFGAPPPPPPFCDSMTKKALPYAIAPDFSFPLVLNAPFTWLVEPGVDCNQTVFPDAAGADAGAGDGGASDGGWSVAPAAAADGGAPSVSTCAVFRYDPDDCVASVAPLVDAGAAVDPGAMCWAGVIFTPSPGGIGAPGICIAPGATAIHFKARASRDGARVKFGSIRAGLGSTEFFILLTTQWADYTVTIPAGEDYDDESPAGGVWNGFSVVAEYQDNPGGTYIFVSDVVWAAQ
jgi:hypothetical protein